MSLFLDKISTSKPTQNKINKSVRLIVLNLAGEAANSDELWLIGEIWRLGRAANFIVNKAEKSIEKFSNSIQLQLKATGKVLRVKWRTGREVEEISMEEIGTKLRSIEESDDFLSENDTHNLNTATDYTTETVADFVDVHFVLATAKAERNPILREKAVKALKLVNPNKPEIVIHELPRDLFKRLIHDNTRNFKVSEEFRDQLMKMGQLLQGKLAGKMVIFINHKDNQIDIIFNK